MKNPKHQIELVPVPLSDYPTIQNMARFYVYDMTEYMGHEKGWEIPADGLFECINLKKYWEVPHAFPFMIRINNEIAGFVIIDKKGSDSQVDFNVAQFFILRKFKKQGIGRLVAYECFDRFKGTWEVMVLPQNKGAYQFWKKIIGDYTKHHFQEYTKHVQHLLHCEKNIFRFQSRS